MFPPAPESPVASPCVRNCCLDDHDVCLGCHRSVQEIMAWGGADNTERRAILERAAQRARIRRNRVEVLSKDRD